MRLSLGIVTDDVPRLRRFYEALLGPAEVDLGDYVELRPGNDWVLGIVTTASIDAYAPGKHVPGSDLSVRIELEVADVEASFEIAVRQGGSVITAPAEFPWGNRAAWLHDPDGNVVSLWSPQVQA